MSKFPSLKGTAAVVTCRNYGRYLAQCLESLLSQTLPFDDILVVDDASTDHTASICWNYAAQGIRYERVVLGEQNAVRAHGMRRTCHEFVVFVDADDWIAHNYHEKMRQALLEKPEAAFAYCGAHVIKDGRDGQWFPGRIHPMRPYDFYDLWRSNTILLPVILRRSAWPSSLGSMGVTSPDGKKFGEDWALWLSILHRGWSAVHVPERLTFYRFHAQNTSRSMVSNRGLEAAAKWSVRKKFLVYDLTVIALMREDPELNAQIIHSLGCAELPLHTQIITVYSYKGQHPSRSGKRLIQPLHVTKKNEMSRDEWLRSALETARPFSRGEEILIAGNGPLNANIFAFLSSGKSKTRSDFFSAGIFCPLLKKILAWRAVKGSPEKGVYTVPVIRRPKRVFAASLNLALISSEAFHDPGLFPVKEQTTYAPLELALGIYARQKKLRWFTSGQYRETRLEFSEEKKYMQKKIAPDSWPKVSVVIPVLNASQTLPLLLESLKNLDYPKDKIEFLAVDNGSKDSSAALAESFKGVRVIRETTPGSYAARNRGIKESSYDLIAFVDSDCTVSRRWLKDLVLAMEENPSCGAVAGDNLSTHPQCRISQIERAAGLFKNYPGSDTMPAYAITMNILYRRSVFESAGMFDQSVFSGSDTEMCWRMQNKTPWKVLLLNQKAWVFHKDHTSPLTFIHRYWRIGGGHEALFNKYPEYRPPFYFWMPQTYWEVFLQSLKNFTRGLLTIYKSNLSVLELVLSEFRSLILKTSMVYHAKTPAGKAPPMNPSVVRVYLGRTPLKPGTALFPAITRRCSETTPCIHVNLVSEPRDERGMLLRYLFGGTTLWQWGRRLFSTGVWKFPFLPPQKNLCLHAARILKIFGASKETLVELSGELTREEFLPWVKAFGAERTRLFPRNTFLGDAAVSFPAAGCVAKRNAALLDGDFYKSLSMRSLWPVIILGVFSPHENEFLENLCWDAPNLYVVNCASQEEAAALGDAKLAVRIRVRREQPPGSLLLSEDFPEKSDFSVLHGGSGSFYAEDGFHSLLFQNPEDAQRWILAWQRMPGWKWRMLWPEHQSLPRAEEFFPTAPENAFTAENDASS